MIILGLSAYYHDSSAALIINGEIVAAALEERFSRIKHDNSFPSEACKFCIKFANINPVDIDEVIFYEKPFEKFERIIQSHIFYAPCGIRQFVHSMPIWLKDKLNMRKTLSKELFKSLGIKNNHIKFCNHHLSHAANAFFQSGFTESGILVIDAVGEKATTSLFKGVGNIITLIKRQEYPNSIGLLYSAFTYFLGFRVNSDEYKVMGLAPYGDPECSQTKKIIEIIKDEIVSISKDGAIVINDKQFSFMYKNRMVDDMKWEILFGIKKREPYSEILQEHMNLAYAIQNITEEIVFKLAKTTMQLTDSKNLCISGGCAMNCSSNGMVLRSNQFDDIYIPYAPDDSGCSIGAALAYYHIGLNQKCNIENGTSYLGPSFTNKEIESTLRSFGLKYSIHTYQNLNKIVSEHLISGRIIGWFQGRMELGPRALGNRSILADPRIVDMKDRINLVVKFREGFRPFAPVVMIDFANQYFDLHNSDNKYMSFTYQCIKDDLPAITHIDKTSRAQLLRRSDNNKLYDLLGDFYSRTGCPVLLNTSFNIMGEPIVCTPKDAIKTFLSSGIDVLVLNNYLIKK